MKRVLAIFIAIIVYTLGVYSQTTIPIRFLPTLPATCVPTSSKQASAYKYTTSGVGRGFFYCSASNTWTAVGGGGDLEVGVTPSDGTANTLTKTSATGFFTNAAGLTNTSTQELMVTSQAATNIPFTVRGHATQSGNLFVIENSAGTDFVYADNFGRFNITDYFTIRYNADIRAGFQYATGFIVSPTYKYAFSSVNSLDSGVDTALERSAAGVIKVTDGASAIRGLLGGGSAVASAAALPLPTGRVFHVTGTTNITSITSTNFASGVCVTMIFDDVLTVTDNDTTLDLAGNFVTTARDTLSVCFDGTNWSETARSVN